MSKNILVISASLRENSNSEVLAGSFAEGAEAAGHRVQKVSLRGKRIEFCTGCLVCQSAGKCVIADDAIELTEKMRQADIIVFATPIYYYGMCGQLKTLLDRANSLFSSEYAFRSIYMLTAAAEDESTVPGRALSGLQGWIDCFEKARIAGSVFAGGVTKAGEAAGHPAVQEAYKLGKSIG